MSMLIIFNQHKKNGNFINDMLHRDSKANTPPQYIESQGTKITSIQEISEAFNTHFASVGSDLPTPTISYRSYFNK